MFVGVISKGSKSEGCELFADVSVGETEFIEVLFVFKDSHVSVESFDLI